MTLYLGIEEWKPYPRNNVYEISNFGNVRKRININHPERNKPYCFLVPFNDSDGYKRIGLMVNGKQTKIHVHRIVYETFNGPLTDGLVCCHVDGDITNNTPQNILQASQKENISHKKNHGTWQAGDRHPRVKYSDEIILQVQNLLATKKPTKISEELNLPIGMIYDVKYKRRKTLQQRLEPVC